MWRASIFCLLLVTTTSCQADSIEERFFEGDILTRLERLETYPLEQQWRIFLYGNQVIHPPITGLALPVAKQGKAALTYILRQTEQSQNDLDFRDSLVVFQSMQRRGYYDVCGDEEAMQAIRSNEGKIRDPDWRGTYSRMLSRMCPPIVPEAPSPE
jgi:hypothetical protein